MQVQRRRSHRHQENPLRWKREKQNRKLWKTLQPETKPYQLPEKVSWRDEGAQKAQSNVQGMPRMRTNSVSNQHGKAHQEL